MIADKDRSFYFGASDTDMIVGSWTSESFARWWLGKLSLRRHHFENHYTFAGTHYEHPILESLAVPDMELDRQIIIEDLRLRVNLDGNDREAIYEVKTYELTSGYSLPMKHIRQVQVQMYATGLRRAYIVSYGLTERDYRNYFLPIDRERLQLHPIPYQEGWIHNTYLPRLTYLARCLTEGRYPNVKEMLTA